MTLAAKMLGASISLLCFVAHAQAQELQEDTGGSVEIIQNKDGVVEISIDMTPQDIVMDCENGVCRTKTATYNACNTCSVNFKWGYVPPPGITFIPSTATGVRLAGHGRTHEVRAHNATPSSMQCQWKVAGKGAFRGGGSVTGYCQVNYQ